MVKEGFNFDGYTECAMEFDKYIRWRRFPRGLIGIRFENSRFIADFVAILGINYGNTYAYVATKSQYGYNFCYVNDPFWKKSKSLQRIDKWRCSVSRLNLSNSQIHTIYLNWYKSHSSLTIFAIEYS